jgi:hypothetical protein
MAYGIRPSRDLSYDLKVNQDCATLGNAAGTLNLTDS